MIILFYPSTIKAVGYSDHQRRAVGRAGGRARGRAVRNSAVTKKLTDNFFLFFIDMTYVPGQFIPLYIYLAPSHKRLFFKMAALKACGHRNL